MTFQYNQCDSLGKFFCPRIGISCAILVDENYEEHFCEIILNVDQWLRRRCLLKIFLILALATNSFDVAERFVQFW